VKLIAIHRLLTGKYVSRGYVMDRDTGKVVWACEHEHKSRLRMGGKNSNYYAQRCAEKQLRRMGER
jgi:hypothetical protein